MEFLAVARDTEHGALADHLVRSLADIAEALVGGQRQDETAPVCQTIEPRFRRPRCARVHIDDIGRIELHQRAIAFDDFNIRPSSKVLFCPRREFRLEFDCRDATRRSRHLRHDRSVVPRAGSHMHGMLTGRRQRLVDEMGVQLRLTVVDASLGNDANKIVRIEINGIGAGRRPVRRAPAKYLPRAGPQIILAPHARKCVFHAGIAHVHGRQYLHRIGPAHDGQFGFVHEIPSRPAFGRRMSRARIVRIKTIT